MSLRRARLEEVAVLCSIFSTTCHQPAGRNTTSPGRCTITVALPCVSNVSGSHCANHCSAESSEYSSPSSSSLELYHWPIGSVATPPTSNQTSNRAQQPSQPIARKILVVTLPYVAHQMQSSKAGPSRHGACAAGASPKSSVGGSGRGVSVDLSSSTSSLVAAGKQHLRELTVNAWELLLAETTAA